MSENTSYVRDHFSIVPIVQHCQAVCDHMVTMVASMHDVSYRSRQLLLLRDCADICALTAQMSARSSYISKQMALLCAHICDLCGQECLRYPDPHSQHCAQVCLHCTSVCRAYASGYANQYNQEGDIDLIDYGKRPFVVNINKATKQNNTFRTALWTGEHLQVTLMSIDVGDDIGLELHPTVDQFLRIEEGQGLVQMGDRKDQLDFEAEVYDDYAIMVPAGKWHNLTNTGDKPLKLYSIYAPPEHPFGTVHKTKEDAMKAEEGGNPRYV
ncbi:mannose-6-phosphate isomerase-like protein (cupin superfamily) [Desmospora profundinema]|uniref:Mannose-6-phosphate isomerase-like protein (Cupin superfamily) n=1 Tax=Desmospora profundinema TaxID=1571184 RepID=A0ABU1IKC3_9BACL|nr:mannose-6-phosphate isomerase-like protein (cupin superfamily) [Desmospora profundinema]